MTWIQCEPCTYCSKQKATIFSPNKSSTYRVIPCTASICHFLSDTSCSATTNTCQYSINYVDKSFTRGSLVTETLTLVSPQVHLRFPDTIFGCGQENDVGKFDDKASGIVGLGGGQESLISQWSRSIGGIFSCCLVPLK